MREITIPYTETHAVSIDLHAALKAKPENGFISLGTADTKIGSGLLSIARNNAGKIIYGVASLENQMQKGITDYLFGIGFPCTSERNFFVRNFMESSFIEFNAKLTIYVRTLESMNLLRDKKAKDDIEAKLRRVMRYRNAMAHGKMKVVNGKISIEYYQGEPKNDTMDEEYLTKLESAFKDAYDSVSEFNNKISNAILNSTLPKDPG